MPARRCRCSSPGASPSPPLPGSARRTTSLPDAPRHAASGRAAPHCRPRATEGERVRGIGETSPSSPICASEMVNGAYDDRKPPSGQCSQRAPTHAPFGHTLEDERCLFPRHDKGERLAVLLAGRLGEQLERLGCLEPLRAILGLETSPGAALAAPPWTRQIVSSTIDADLLDYLR